MLLAPVIHSYGKSSYSSLSVLQIEVIWGFLLPGMAVLSLLLLLGLTHITAAAVVAPRIKAGSRWRGEKNRE